MTPTAPSLNRPPLLYFPFERGVYEVSAGLTQLGKQAVHGRVETHVFAFDREYSRILAAKVEARSRLHLFYQQSALPPELREAVLRVMLSLLARDSEGGVEWNGETLTNHWLGWRAAIDVSRGTVASLERVAAPLAPLVRDVTPLDALDFFALNIPEDFSIVARSPETGEDWLACLHVSMPQHWDPRDKIGRDFGSVHAPVGGSAAMIATAPRLMQALTVKGPFTRFAWGLTTTDRLEHHPATRQHEDRAGERGFDPRGAFVRVERQTLTPFAAESGAFFTIRPYVYPLVEVAADEARRAQLASALRSMTSEHLAYKGMTAWRDDAAAWLET